MADVRLMLGDCLERMRDIPEASVDCIVCDPPYPCIDRPYGRMTEADLTNAAQSASQRVEAQFYTAIARRASGDPAGETRLRDVAKSSVIELLEVQLAREILAPRTRTELPRGLPIP